MLHVTNGDALAARIRAAQARGAVPPGDVLPWRDALHDGPVPDGSDAQVRAARAAFLAECGFGAAAEIEAGFAERDARLDAAVAEREELVLWFDRDLYDRLQLAQVSARLAASPRALRPGPRLVEVDERVPPGDPAGDPAGLWAAQRGQPRCATAGLAVEWRALVAGRLDLLPVRLREELPWTTDGLARSERQALQALADGARTIGDVFAAQLAAEERPFLGDAWLGERLRRVEPLALPEGDGGWVLSDAGRAVLAGEADAVPLMGLDRRLGGLHLTAASHPRWDPAARRVLGYPSRR